MGFLAGTRSIDATAKLARRGVSGIGGKGGGSYSGSTRGEFSIYI
jgi:hypothetical protein